MNLPSVKDMVTGKKVRFLHYTKGELIYVTECGFEFPVPISDTGDGVFNSEDSAVFFMRWIRKHRAMLIAAKEDSLSENTEN